MAARLLEQVLADFEEHGINEAVNHEFVYSSTPKQGPRTYVGTMGYLASAASVYSAIWEPVVDDDIRPYLPTNTTLVFHVVPH